MSIRFFPLFFLDDLELSPIAVQALYIASPLTIIWLSKLARKISVKRGRCQTTVFFKWVGIASMAAMLLAYTRGASVYLVLALYLLRTVTMNCTKALTSSQLYDCVKKEERGKFTVLESVNMFSWSGSAAVGGFLVGEIGIVGNFAVTGTLQFVSTLPLLLLFGLASEEAQSDERKSLKRRSESQASSGQRKQEELEEPLLGKEAPTLK